MHELWPVEIEHRPGFVFVGFETLLDDFQVGVIQPVLAERAALEPLGHLAQVGAVQVEDGFDIQGVVEHLRLVDTARDAVEHERVQFRLELAVVGAGFNVFAPQRDGRLVRHEMALAGILDERAPDGVVDAQVAERVAAREVKQVGNRAQDFPLRALAGAGRAEEQDGAVFHGSKVLVPDLYFADFGVGNHHLGGGAALGDLQIKLVRLNARDALARVLAARGFDVNDHVLYF